MSEETLIQWASSTWNPWIGCDKVSPGCWLCYIVNTTPFRTRELKHGDPRQRLSENYWKQPARWNAAAEAALRGWEAAGKMEAMGMPVKKADPRDGSLCCHGCTHEGPHPLKLIHKKGGDVYEWPQQLRVREFPKNL